MLRVDMNDIPLILAFGSCSARPCKAQPSVAARQIPSSELTVLEFYSNSQFARNNLQCNYAFINFTMTSLGL